MSDVWVGVIAVVAGLVLCFRGRSAARAILGLWGAFVGFVAGAAIGAALSGGEAPLTGAVSWVAAVVGALLLGGLAYTFYVLAVVITLASVGYGLGHAAASLAGAQDGLATVVGLVAALVLGVIALRVDLPGLVLVIGSALAGAGALVLGVQLLLGLISRTALTSGAVPARQDVGWVIAYWALAIVGMIVQWRRHTWDNASASWPSR